jgi:hypothetical protein
MPLLWRLALYAGVLLSVFLGWKAYKHSIWSDGRNAGRAEIVREVEAGQAKEIEHGQEARAAADAAVEHAGIAGMRNDPNNRDNDCRAISVEEAKQADCKAYR